MSATATPQWFEDLKKYDTPTVCNAIELFDVRPRNTGYMNDSIKACFPKMPPMVGYAVTSTFRSQQPPRGGDVYASMSDQVASFKALPGLLLPASPLWYVALVGRLALPALVPRARPRPEPATEEP